MKILKLTLRKDWFNLVLAGIKTEEYREIKKFWNSRLLENSLIKKESYRNYDLVEFTNGYNKNSPRITLEFKGIRIDTGVIEWGAIADVKYYVIKLGNEISRENC